jgi:hypothetical protein
MWDPICDIVVLPKKFDKYQFGVLKVSCPFQLKVLKNLAVPGCFWLIGSRAPFLILSAIATAFPNLEQLIICLGGETEQKTMHPPNASFFHFRPARDVSKQKTIRIQFTGKCSECRWGRINSLSTIAGVDLLVGIRASTTGMLQKVSIIYFIFIVQILTAK